MYLLEACVETPEEALFAQQKGADRIEYCSALEHDGLTPDIDEVRMVLNEVKIPVVVMIRPRRGNFEYTEAEFEVMKQQVLNFKKIGVAGVVFGILKGQCVDLERTKLLAELAHPLEVCFHKAIDEVEDLVAATETLAAIPEITRILTSGGAATAKDGADNLRKMMRQAADRVSLMPAGKVRPENVEELHKILGAREYHGRGIVR